MRLFSIAPKKHAFRLIIDTIMVNYERLTI